MVPIYMDMDMCSLSYQSSANANLREVPSLMPITQLPYPPPTPLQQPSVVLYS